MTTFRGSNGAGTSLGGRAASVDEGEMDGEVSVRALLSCRDCNHNSYLCQRMDIL